MNLADNFEIVPRMYEVIWVHKTKPCQIVYYPATQDRREFYEAYTIIGKIDKNKNNNRRLSDGDGYKTLEAAMQAVEDLA